MTGLRSALVALGCITSAQADVTEQNLQRPYTVDAQPGESLRQALNRSTPIAVTGQPPSSVVASKSMTSQCGIAGFLISAF